ncbi:MAG: universal stress protein [Pseudomonadota bacterium]
MSTYTNLLVAIDLSNESARVIARARQLADGNSTSLSLIHIVEPVSAAYPIDAYAINISKLQDEAIEIATERMADIGKDFDIPVARQHVVIGSAATEIRAMAEELSSDLIVIGSHGRSGWKLLLGSTANKVLHGAHCDILTVRVGD